MCPPLICAFVHVQRPSYNLGIVDQGAGLAGTVAGHHTDCNSHDARGRRTLYLARAIQVSPFSGVAGWDDEVDAVQSCAGGR